MRRRGVVVLLAWLVTSGLLVITAACASGPANSPGSPTAPVSSSPTSIPAGIRGVTTVDGGCPVVRSGPPCPERPIAARITATLGSTVRSVISDSAGHFELPLPPGTYQVQASSPDGSPLPMAAPRPVVVQPARFTIIAIQLDSGVR